MKKLYLLLFSAAAIFFGSVAADAATVTITVDNPSRISAKIDYNPVELIAGLNTIETQSDYPSITFDVTPGAIVTELTQNGTVVARNFASTQYIYANGNTDITISTALLEEVRTGTITINIDNASKVNVLRGGTYSDVELTDGANTVKFIPGAESYISIEPKVYGMPLFNVKHNGEEISASYGTYEIYIAEGSVIDITADYPDIDLPVKFAYLNDGKEFVSKVVLNRDTEAEKEVTNYNDDNFTVKCGDRLTIYGNTADFKFNSLVYNDNEQSYFYGSYDFVVVSETNITIDATKYAMLKANINVDCAARVKVYKGSSYYENTFDLVDGDNAVEINSSNTYIEIKAASGCLLKSITRNGEAVEPNWSGEFSLYLAEGDNVVITTAEIVRNNSVVFYIDKVPETSYGLSIMNSKREYFRDFKDGYNVLKYADDEAPYYVGLYSTDVCQVYLDDELLSPEYEGSTSFTVQLPASGSVVKIFTAALPELCNVKFGIDESAKAAFKGVRDLVKEFSFDEDLSVLSGTEIELTCADAENSYTVRVNGEELAPAEKYNITVTGDTAVEIISNGTTGVENLESDAASSTVYNLQGIVVLKNASAADINALPAGVYIVNGKKIVK